MSNMEILLPFVSPILLAHLAEAGITETVLADALLNQRQLLVNLCQAFFQLLIISIISADGNNLGILLLGNIAQLPGTAVAQIINQLRILNRNSFRTDARQHICYGLNCFMRSTLISFNSCSAFMRWQQLVSEIRKPTGNRQLQGTRCLLQNQPAYT